VQLQLTMNFLNMNEWTIDLLESEEVQPSSMTSMENACKYTLCPEKKPPPPKESTVTLIILNRNQWKLHRTDWHQFEHCVLNCKWVQFQGRDIISCFQRHTKNAFFQNESIYQCNEQPAKQSRLQMVFKMSAVSVHTLSQSSMLLITMLFW